MISDKLSILKEYMNTLCSENICVAFSGGVDSALILDVANCEANKNNTKVYAVTFLTKLHTVYDIETSKSICKQMGVEHIILDIDEFENIEIINNPINRCYICKKYIFQNLIEFASSKNINICVDGTNFDDLNEYRPGIKALNELNIISPLMELKFTKKDIRYIAEKRGISVSNKPSAPCLATRLPYNTNIDFKILKNIEEGENFLRNIGFYNIRIRLHNDIARIEIDKKYFNKFIDNSDIILDKLKDIGFIYVTLDIEGFRSGSMDININKK